MITRFFFLLGKLAIYILPVLFGSFLTYSLFAHQYLNPIEPGSQETVSFELQKGWNLKIVSQELEKQKLIRNWWSVYYLANLKTDKEGLKLLPGEYKLSPGYSPSEILDAFVRGDVVYYDITLSPGMSTRDIAQLLAKTTLVNEQDVESALNDRQLMSKIGVPSSSFEGYLWPETYRFTRPVGAEEMLARMFQEGQKHKPREMFEKAEKLGFSFHQILTLASVIEKETADPSERGKISSVFHNRLRIGMPLQSDPTVIYGISDFNGNLTKDDLKTPSPYNTYLNTGLPPTPICMPGLASIEAALNPADTEFLYFVAKGDGTHHFSATYKEHREAVQEYQKNPAQRSAKAESPAAGEDLIREVLKSNPAEGKEQKAPEPQAQKMPDGRSRIGFLDPVKPKYSEFVGIQQPNADSAAGASPAATTGSAPASLPPRQKDVPML